MQRPNLRNFLFVLLTVFLTIPVFAQFGQNKVQYHKFDWHYLQSEHFDVYFYRGSYDIAVFVADEAEKAYQKLKDDFEFEITKRISIILYKSHNDWQQTNVIDIYLTEGIGGVTELYKNRVVIPFEGSYKQLRHVLHHELVHAVMNDMLYGGSIQSLISGQVVPVPLWFSEGLAEFLSLGWDTRTDMIVRDATISNLLPPIQYLDYYLAYQGGNSVFRYIERKYGRKKVTEIIHKIKGSFRFEGAIKAALGIDMKELSEDWQKQLRKDYWPEIIKRREPMEIARPLTDHKETENYLNIAPALSPRGDKMLFLSNMDGKISIYLMDVLEQTIERTLIEGESDVDFEELHWLSPGMSWSPDGSKVTFSAKAGDQDALYIYNLDDDSIQKYKLNMDGIFSTAWSPTRDEIAFIGNKNAGSDLYIFDVNTKEVRAVTHDIFWDGYPEWSPDGERLVFVSERGQYADTVKIPQKIRMSKFNYENVDIYTVDRDGSNLTRVTNTESQESDPVFSKDGHKLLYVCDESGAFNIYVHDLDSNKRYPITNFITGAFQLSVDKDRQTLAFTTFYEGGFDIYTLKNPFEMDSVKVEDTYYIAELKKEKKEKEPAAEVKQEAVGVVEQDSVIEKVRLQRSVDYSRYVFADLEQLGTKQKEKVELKPEEYKFDDGNYKVHNYKIRFSPDIIYGAAQFNTLWGFQGYTQLAFSDVLGDHKIFIGTNLVFDLRNSYLSFQYWYLANRINLSFFAYHYGNTVLSAYYGLMRFRNYGAALIASRPFDKFTRVDFALNWLNVRQEYLQVLLPSEDLSSILPSLQLVRDTADWGFTGPINGFRGLISMLVSPKYSPKSPDFTTFQIDVRKYIKIVDDYSIAMRFAGGASFGANPQQFYLGGVPYWFNPEYGDGSGGRGGLRYDSIKDVYFSEFVTPLRGARYYERIGNNFSLINLELRFPLIRFLQLGLPPITLGNIRGVLFTDIGSAWSSYRSFQPVEGGKLKDVVAGYGVGMRVYLFGLLFKYDIAWPYDLSTSYNMIQYFSMGIDF